MTLLGREAPEERARKARMRTTCWGLLMISINHNQLFVEEVPQLDLLDARKSSSCKLSKLFYILCETYDPHLYCLHSFRFVVAESTDLHNFIDPDDIVHW